MKQIGLALTDTHLKEDNIELVTDIWNQAIQKCIELKIKRIFFFGDFFTARKAQTLLVDEAGRKIINNVLCNAIDLIMIPGNHDKVDQDSESSYLDEYSGYSGCKVITNYDTFKQDNLVIHFLPYFKENTVYPDKLSLAVKNVNELNKTENNLIHILCTHIAINGVKNNDGTLIENNLDNSKFNVFSKVLIGHYHNRSFVEPNFCYVGSAYQANYGEDNRKGFIIINEDGTFDFIQSNFKEFIKIKLDITDDKAIKEAKVLYQERASVDHVRFIFEGEEAELKNVNKEKFESLGIEVDFNKYSAVPMNNEDLITKASSVSFDRQNITEVFDIFCQTKHIEDNSIGKEYLSQIK